MSFTIPVRAGRRGAFLGGVLVVLLAAAACGSSSAGGAGGPGGGAPATRLTVLLDWFPNPDHIALYLAQKDGDFAARGLDVTLQAPSNSTDALKLVSLGQVPLAISYEPDVVTAASQGLDVTAVAALIPTPLDTLIISGKSGITSPAGLAGQAIGTDGDPVEKATGRVILAKYGVTPARTKLITVNEGLIPAIVSGKVAAIIGGYRNVEAIQLAYEGLRPRVYPVNREGVPGYDELVVIANKQKLARDAAYRATIRTFLAGLAAGDAAAQARPAAALAALAPVAKGYRPVLLKEMVDATAPLLKNPRGFGAMDAASWQTFANWMLGHHLISRPVRASSIVDTALLPES